MNFFHKKTKFFLKYKLLHENRGVFFFQKQTSFMKTKFLSKNKLSPFHKKLKTNFSLFIKTKFFPLFQVSDLRCPRSPSTDESRGGGGKTRTPRLEGPPSQAQTAAAAKSTQGEKEARQVHDVDSDGRAQVQRGTRERKRRRT